MRLLFRDLSKSQAENLTPFVVAEQWEIQPHVNAVSLWLLGK